MSIENLKERIPEFARDIRLNVSSVLGGSTGTPGLEAPVAYGTAYACAVASGNRHLIEAIEGQAGELLDEARRNAARSAAAVMAMNNVYYRFVHFTGDEEYARLPARLRMNVIGRPGIDKAEFELYCLAVSAMNGCEFCVKAHERVVRGAGYTREGVQSAGRIAAVVAATANVLSIAAPEGDETARAA
ncbi:MAG: carboxymuconolactone decarboxylase family protein [Gammaproteobacteria bacterium]